MRIEFRHETVELDLPRVKDTAPVTSRSSFCQPRSNSCVPHLPSPNSKSPIRISTKTCHNLQFSVFQKFSYFFSENWPLRYTSSWSKMNSSRVISASIWLSAQTKLDFRKKCSWWRSKVCSINCNAALNSHVIRDILCLIWTLRIYYQRPFVSIFLTDRVVSRLNI